MDEVDQAIREEILGKVEVREERDACVMRVNARALLRSHSGDIKIQMEPVILGRGDDEGEVEGVIGISNSKKVSRRACKIRHDEATE